VGSKGYSGTPAAPTFACRDGWLAIGANTPAHITRLMQVLGVESAEVAPLLEPVAESGPAFARARDPQAFRELLAARLVDQSATDLEQRLNANGVPTARVRTLREFMQEAVNTTLERGSMASAPISAARKLFALVKVDTYPFAARAARARCTGCR
jgi:crotonobetainyl-CoA:carnitine CoA-transferase CaiB-like acyl-CoA transferase